jgi:hypothetical protein
MPMVSGFLGNQKRPWRDFSGDVNRAIHTVRQEKGRRVSFLRKT